MGAPLWRLSRIKRLLRNNQISWLSGFTLGALTNITFQKQCVVKGLFTLEPQTISAETLHPTSRYRIFRLLRAINRKPIEPETV